MWTLNVSTSDKLDARDKSCLKTIEATQLTLLAAALKTKDSSRVARKRLHYFMEHGMSPFVAWMGKVI